MTYDLIIRSAQLRGSSHLIDIGISDGHVVSVSPELAADAVEVIDAAGRLVVPGFVDSHFHIGKSFFGRETHRYDYQQTEWDPAELAERYRHRYRSGMGDLEVYHENVVPLVKQWAWKEAYSAEDVADRICDALSLGLGNGVVACRMFVDVDSYAQLTELEGAVEAKRRFGGLMQLQICAFPQEGLYSDPQTAALMVRAMENGADVVGGLPHVEWTDELCHKHADFCFELAERFEAPLHFLCDDVASPMSRTLEYVAAKTMEAQRYGRVASSHNGALSVYPDAHAVKVLNMIRDAEMNISCNSQVNLLGILTRVHEMVDYGINVSVGQDDLDNFYYPFGREDPLEWAWSIAHAGSFAYPKGIEQVFDMLTVNGAKTLGLENYGLEVGCRADLVVLDCAHPRDAIQFQVDRLHVITNGRRVAGTKRERWLAEPASLAAGHKNLVSADVLARSDEATCTSRASDLRKDDAMPSDESEAPPGHRHLSDVPHEWARLSATQIVSISKDAVIVQPIGSLEQHGPHLPVVTDAYIAESIVRGSLALLAEDDPEVIVLPTLSYGRSIEHAGFVGTVALCTDTLLEVCRDIGRSVAGSGFRRLVFVNAHGGNVALLEVASRDIRAETGLMVFRIMLAHFGVPEGVECPDVEFGAHADFMETSVMLALDESMVHMERAQSDGQGASRLFGHPQAGTVDDLPPTAWLVRDLSRSGVIGDPRGATGDVGRRIVEHWQHRLVGCYREIAIFEFGSAK